MNLDSKTEGLAGRLHKGLGVRRPRLRDEIVRTRLGELWGVTGGHSAREALAIVSYRLESVFRSVPDRHVRLIAPMIYNLAHDVRMHDLDLGARQDLLHAMHPGEERYAKRSTSRMITTLVNTLIDSLIDPTRVGPDSPRKPLRPPLPAVPADELLAIVVRETEFEDLVAGVVGPNTFERAVGDCYKTMYDPAARMFLRLRALVPKSRTGELIIARTAADGDWLCVFSNENNLRAHQRAVPGQPWSGRWDIIRGGDIVRAVASRWDSVGIVVNPAIEPQDAVRSLRLPPQTVAELAEGR